MDKNIQSWDNSANSSDSNFDYLVDGRNIQNFLSEKIFLVRDSKRKSYSIYFAIENNILEVEKNIENNIFEVENNTLEVENNISQVDKNIREMHNDILEIRKKILEYQNNGSRSNNNDNNIVEIENDTLEIENNTLEVENNGSKSNNNDHYISDIKSNWNKNFNSCIESYLRSQICIDSSILDDSSKYDDLFDFYLKYDASNLESDYENPMAKFAHLWVRCDQDDCYGLNYKKVLKSNLNICEHCGSHLKMNSSDRIELLIDPGTWNPMDEYMFSLDPIEFDSEDEPYLNRLDSYQETTGLNEAIQTGTGQLNGIPLAIGFMEFEFMGGSMGSVVGEKITRLIEYATNQRLPLILVCASGGARMQEGSVSLMQMAKISCALYNYQINQKLFYIPILTSPTTGGVTASFGMLGDIIIAEPNAYIAFAGKRVIEETLKIEVPEGSQSAEVLFEKGLVDSIVPRTILKAVLTELFQLHGFVPLTQNEK